MTGSCQLWGTLLSEYQSPFERFILLNMYHKHITRSGAYGLILDGFKLVCSLLCSCPQRLSSGSQVKLFRVRDVLQEASLVMYYWATDNKPDLTHSSVMKKWSCRVQFFFQSMIRWFQNLLVLNYSYAFERSFASASLIMLDYTLAHTWLYSWARCVLSHAMVFRFHQWLHWEQEKEKNKRFTAKLSRNVIEKNRACLLSK